MIEESLAEIIDLFWETKHNWNMILKSWTTRMKKACSCTFKLVSYSGYLLCRNMIFVWLCCRIHHDALEYVSFGKPNPFVFKNTETLLAQLQPSHCDNDITTAGDSPSHAFKTLYMIGDNPSVDVKGARQVCLSCFLSWQVFTVKWFECALTNHHTWFSGWTSLVFYFDEDRRF